MPGFFFNLGQFVGPKARKGKWVWDSLTASADEILQSEFETGRDMAAAMLAQMPVDRTSESAQRVQQIADRLAGRLTDRRRRWMFHVTATGGAGEAPNAFALPGGFIFITRSLVELCEGNADEIAFILGHEVGHVIRGHSLDRLVSSTLLTVASRATPVGRMLSPHVIGAGLKLMQSAYTQDQELEADSFGVRLAHSASFDPAASIRMMQRLAAMHGDGPLPEVFAYFSTHPPFASRIAELHKHLGR